MFRKLKSSWHSESLVPTHELYLVDNSKFDSHTKKCKKVFSFYLKISERWQFSQRQLIPSFLTQIAASSTIPKQN